MALAPLAYLLFTRHLRHNPANPLWMDRDRFVLSAGHASMLLYSVLYLSGYDLSLDDLKQFRQWDSRTPGHPEHGVTPGVETTTGPLGQGVGNAVGFAVAEAHLAAVFNSGGHRPVDHHTLLHRQRRRHDGGGLPRIGIARRTPAAGQAHRLLRRQPHHHRGRHRPRLQRGRRRPLPGVRLARAARGRTGTTSTRSTRAIHAAKAATDRPSLVDRPHSHRVRQPQQGGHRRGARLAAGRGRDPAHQAGARVALDRALPRPRRCARRMAEVPRPRRGAGGGMAAALRTRFEAAQPDRAKELERRYRGELPAGWDADIPSFPRREAGRDPERLGEGAQRHRTAAAGADGRRRRSRPLHQDADEGRRRLRGRPLLRPQHALRHP